MKILVVLCTVLSVNLALLSDVLDDIEWNKFKTHYKKKYTSAKEESYRKKVFVENKRKIVEHNKKFLRGEVTYKMGFNEYGDKSHEEFLKAMIGPFDLEFKPKMKGVDLKMTYITLGSKEIPLEVDWREQGVVTPARKQGYCGSCWAFATAAAIESQYLKNGKNISYLSPQNLIDCAGDYGTYGCKGGFRNYAFEYIIDNGGINTEESYPYEEKDGPCRYNPNNVGASLSGFFELPSGDEQAMREVIANFGPVGGAMDASMETLQFYSSGIYQDSECWKNETDLNHDLLMVGYGISNGTDYWIMKNSWGRSWGENGFFKISTARESCGLIHIVSFPVISGAVSCWKLCLELIVIMNCFLLFSHLK